MRNLCSPAGSRDSQIGIGRGIFCGLEYFKETADAVASLKEQGYRIVSVEQAENSVWLQEIAPKKGERYALVFGNEVKGVQQSVVDMSDEVVEIPQWGTKHSLNVSVSVGVVLWEYSKKIALCRK